MKTTKLLASLVVVCMLATCMFCIAETDDTNGDIIRSKDCVIIDVDESFQENKNELAKLGITDYKCWQYSDEYGCYVLVLDNVHFKTTSLDGLVLISYSDNANPKVVIKLVGNNSIVSGTKKTLEIQEEEVACAIVSTHVKNGAHMNDMNVIVTGKGTLEATNADLSHDIIATFGVFVHGNLAVCDDARLKATGGGFEHCCKAEHAVNKLEICSCGVYVTNELTISHASVLGTGGDVYTVFEKQEQEGKQIIYYSEGITAAKYLIDDGYVRGIGGKIDWNTMKQEYITPSGFIIHAFSKGLSTLTDYSGEIEYEHSVEIRLSKVIGEADSVKGLITAMSCGISFESAETIGIVGSMIFGTSGDAFALKEGSNANETIGISLDGNTNIKSSFVQGASGNHANASLVEIADGICCDGNLCIDDVIIIGSGRVPVSEATLKENYGIIVYGDFNINDSEVYAKGFGQAIKATKLNTSLGNRGCYSLDNDWNRTAIEVDDLDGNHTAVELLYKYDMLIKTLDNSLIVFARYATADYTVVFYPEIVPDGMKFTGYEDLDGNAVAVGTTCIIDEPLVLVATFGVAEKSDSGNAVVAWIIVIVALIVVALLVVGLSVSRKLKG